MSIEGTPIVDPILFYYIDVITSIPTGILILDIVIFLYYLLMSNKENEKHISRLLGALCMITILAYVFIPNSLTLHKMMLARYTTYENLERLKIHGINSYQEFLDKTVDAIIKLEKGGKTEKNEQPKSK